jgi:hypothetical protein
MRSSLRVPPCEEKRAEPLSPLTEEIQRLLESHLPPAALEVFPEWQGVLLTCEEFARAVWIVRTIQDGRQLHAATGHPALLLDDLLVQRGRSFADIWTALQPYLIVSHGRNSQGERE